MRTKILLTTDELKQAGKRPESTLMNFRIEKRLKDAFVELCQKELDQDYSKVLRAWIEQFCKQNGFKD